MKHVGAKIAGAQITNGGPIILVQPENEYTQALDSIQPFPDPVYMNYVEDQIRDAGIIVPLISNDASPKGYLAPGDPAGVDIYGHDGYPLGFDCANPNTWPDGNLPTTWHDLHEEQSPTTPYSILEFQSGSFDPVSIEFLDYYELYLTSFSGADLVLTSAESWSEQSSTASSTSSSTVSVSPF